MTQGRFTTMGKIITKIINKIVGNETIIRLVKFTDADPLQKKNNRYVHEVNDSVIDQVIDNNIKIAPVIPDEDEFNESYLVIVIEQYEDNANVDFKNLNLRIDVICPTNSWKINNIGLRPFLIMNEIDNMLNGAHIEGLGSLQFQSANLLAVSPYYSGYTIRYGLADFN